MMQTLSWLEDEDYSFPDPEQALREPNGLLAAGGDLEPGRLLQAYQRGIFPWYEEGQPVLWWSPDPRLVLFPEDFHVSRSLRKVIRRQDFTLSTDRAFQTVVEACAAPRHQEAGTWITRAMQSAYLRLHLAGHAHSLEVWRENKLAGGLYGVALGRVFFGESMFSREPDTSKLALAMLAAKLPTLGFRFIDCQVTSPHLRSLGAREISRRDFMTRLPTQAEIDQPPPWPTNFDETY